jgi:hypothetical protein
MPKFRKGELKFYKSMIPSELNEYINKFPINTEYVKQFFEKYKYNYVKRGWFKKGII